MGGSGSETLPWTTKSPGKSHRYLSYVNVILTHLYDKKRAFSDSSRYPGRNIFKKEIECSYFIHHMSPLWGYKGPVETLNPSCGGLNVTPAPSIGRVLKNGTKYSHAKFGLD